MPEQRDPKYFIRLNQAADLMRRLVATFGESVILDALAVTLQTTDGKALLAQAAEFARAANEQSPASLPSPEHSADVLCPLPQEENRI